VSDDAEDVVAAITTIAVGLYGIPYIERWFRRVSDPVFFKDTYIYSVALERLSDILCNIELSDLIILSLRELTTILKPHRAYFIYSISGDVYSLSGKENDPLSSEELPKELRIPVQDNGEILGWFTLGSKRSGDRYTEDDERLLRTFATQATIAIQKAELYQKLKLHNEQLENKVLERTRHLALIQEQQREFFDDVSHALQTPLTVLKSGLELLSAERSSESMQIYSTLERSVDDLSRHIRDLLELARIDTRKEDELYRLFDLSALTSRTVEYVHIIAQAKDILFSTAIHPGINLRGDEHQVEELLINLLSNAIRYTETSPTRAIRLLITLDGSDVLIDIRDTGIGMSSDQMKYIYDRHYRSEPNGRARGFGIGMAIVKRIVTRHGGSISLESNVGNGTRVIVRLPYSHLTPEATGEPESKIQA